MAIMMSYAWGFRGKHGAEGFARKSLGMGAIAALLAFPQPSLHPCSVKRGYRVPSDYDLVKSHDVIVLARSEDYEGGQFLFRIRRGAQGRIPEPSLPGRGPRQLPTPRVTRRASGSPE